MALAMMLEAGADVAPCRRFLEVWDDDRLVMRFLAASAEAGIVKSRSNRGSCRDRTTKVPTCLPMWSLFAAFWEKSSFRALRKKSSGAVPAAAS